MERHPSTLVDALNSIQLGDRRRGAALAIIFKTLVRLKRRLRTSAETADDAVQTVACTLWRRGLSPRVRSEGQGVAFLWRMLRNAAIGEWRVGARYELADDVEVLGATHLTPERLAMVGERLEHVSHATSRLLTGDPRARPQDRAALARRVERGLRTRGVIAGEVDLPSGRDSAEAKAEQRAVQRGIERRGLARDAIDQATKALLVSMRDLRGQHGD
jgi:DNA-directed RNA polymerase specialized sigma24 family protein